MLGTSWANRTTRRYLSCSPFPSLERSGSTLQSAPAGHPIRSRHLETAFRSPTTAACFQATMAGSALPACFFDAALELSSSPFGPHSPTRSGLPRFGQAPRDWPVVRRCSDALRSFPDFHSPLRIFRSLADRSVQSGHHREAHLCETPDFLSLPACGLFLVTRPWIIVPDP